MKAAWIAILAVVIMIGGFVAGVASLLFAPIAGFLLLIALVVWMAARKAEGKTAVPKG